MQLYFIFWYHISFFILYYVICVFTLYSVCFTEQNIDVHVYTRIFTVYIFHHANSTTMYAASFLGVNEDMYRMNIPKFSCEWYCFSRVQFHIKNHVVVFFLWHRHYFYHVDHNSICLQVCNTCVYPFLYRLI